MNTRHFLLWLCAAFFDFWLCGYICLRSLLIFLTLDSVNFLFTLVVA